MGLLILLILYRIGPILPFASRNG